MDDQRTLAQRLSSDEYEYDEKDVLRALRGEKLPEHLGYPLIKICIIRGILHSASFAEGEAAILHGLPEHPEFTRALNARAIMSNRVPDMNHPEEVPYCIWYPTVASHDTYRELSIRYPQMSYQVARACAVAGYTNLYHELENVLPEIAVAEEALAAGSTAIFESIMAQPARYRVFNDYSRTIKVEDPRTGDLNGDTCAVAMVESQKQRFTAPLDPDYDDGFIQATDSIGFEELMYNMTEDHGIQETFPSRNYAPVSSRTDLMVDLLTAPLPTNLPPGNKDLLIVTAAYYGNIDRYIRLRRPKMLEDEIFCIIRGIYHNSLFALYWERHQNPLKSEPFHIDPYGYQRIQQAITARHIMNNDLSRAIAKKDDADYLPYLIWYPEYAQSSTYKALATRVPKMRDACVRAAIYTEDVALFDAIIAMPDVKPNRALVVEAKDCKNPYFLSALESRAKELGIGLNPADANYQESYEVWKFVTVKNSMRKGNWLPQTLDVHLVSGEYREGYAIYNGVRATTTRLEMLLMIPESWRPRDGNFTELDYENWPPSW